MKLRYIITLFFVLFIGLSASAQSSYKQVINTLASDLASSISSEGKKTITVTDFLNVENNLTELGIDVANSLETAFLKNNNSFRLVSRDELNRILDEQEISRSRITEKENVKRIGQISNVDVIVVGTLSSWGEQITVGAKLLDVETGELIGASDGEVTATGVVKQKFEKVVQFDKSEKCIGCPVRPVPSEFTSKQGSFEIDLVGCRQYGQKITCDLTITTKGKDGVFTIYQGTGKTRIFTNSNKEIKASNIMIIDTGGNRNVTKEFVADLPAKASVEFDGIDQSISSIPKLNISANARGHSIYLITWRNVPVN